TGFLSWLTQRFHELHLPFRERHGPGEEPRLVDLLRHEPPHDRRGERRELLVASKVDLATAAAPVPAGTLRTSVVTGEGIAALAAAIVRRLVPEEVDEPGLLAGAVPFTERQVKLVESLREP
ncbi:MAG: hypothetical protein ACKOK8_07840, partial [Planctomycetia bacterium]